MSEEKFAVIQEQHGVLPLLRVRGEVDIYTAPRLKEAIVTALNADIHSIALDFSEVSFLDSTGLQVLVSARRRTAERDGELYLLGIRDQVRRVFTLLGLEKIFQVCHEGDLPER